MTLEKKPGTVPAFVETKGGFFRSVTDGRLSLVDGVPTLVLDGVSYQVMSRPNTDPLTGESFFMEAWVTNAN